MVPKNRRKSPQVLVHFQGLLYNSCKHLPNYLHPILSFLLKPFKLPPKVSPPSQNSQLSLPPPFRSVSRWWSRRRTEISRGPSAVGRPRRVVAASRRSSRPEKSWSCCSALACPWRASSPGRAEAEAEAGPAGPAAGSAGSPPRDVGRG